MVVKKRNGELVKFDESKIKSAIEGAFDDCDFYKGEHNENVCEVLDLVIEEIEGRNSSTDQVITVEEIQDIVERTLMITGRYDVARAFIQYRFEHKKIREYVEEKERFINRYKRSGNTADATIDDNSNVSSKNIAIINNEIHKPENVETSRGLVMRKIRETHPDFDPKQYIRDLTSHWIYKHDESSMTPPPPYCVSETMYPFLISGIRGIGGLSAAPKNIDSFCGMYINMIFAVSSQFAGAVATPEFLMYFDYFARKEWGDDYYLNPDKIISCNTARQHTIGSQIHQYFQQVVYSINQPSAARGMQSAFVNFAYFDKPFFDGMFGHFVFPDGTQPKWDSLNWLQKNFMQWFNAERLKTMITFPVESFALVYKDGKFVDQENADFVAEEYARGHSFFTYISDTVDSLSSCCRLKNKVQTKEFNFTNGNMGVMTGSKSVITLNLNRITQDSYREWANSTSGELKEAFKKDYSILGNSLHQILERVYIYHEAYNDILWDAKNSGLLPVYDAGFIDLDKQYLTIGINGLNEAAEFLGIECSDNPEYENFCQFVFSTIKELNTKHKTKHLTFNTECVPAESLAVKNYNWDKEDGYWVPEDRNLYASYIYIPSSKKETVYDRIRMHGRRFIGDYLDGGSAAHINLNEHLTKDQYANILNYAAEEGCQYLTFNIPNSECAECHFIAKSPFDVCPKCGSHKVINYDRVIGYLTAIPNWSEGRRIEQTTRDYTSKIC